MNGITLVVWRHDEQRQAARRQAKTVLLGDLRCDIGRVGLDHGAAG